jgi:hypothetical protein
MTSNIFGRVIECMGLLNVLYNTKALIYSKWRYDKSHQYVSLYVNNFNISACIKCLETDWLTYFLTHLLTLKLTLTLTLKFTLTLTLALTLTLTLKLTHSLTYVDSFATQAWTENSNAFFKHCTTFRKES